MSGASQSGRRSELTAGVDIGTTSVKAVVADEDGNVVGRAKLASDLVIGPGGRFEHDAVKTWWDSPRAVLHQVLSRNPAQAVSVSAMMPSVAAVDGSGRPLGKGLLYGDNRGRQQGSGDPTASEEMAHLSGWVARNAPGAAGYWPAQAVANASLGGEGVTDLASAFASGPLFNGSEWDAGACAAAGLLPSQLPRVAVFGEAVGQVGPEALGTQAQDGELMLGAGSVDGLCEQLVAGTVNDGDVLISLGSTLVVWLTVPGWPAEPPNLWRVPHIAAGKAMVGGASNAGGIWADWVDRVVRPADAAGAPEEVPLWWPWAKGERVPWHDRSLRIGLAEADLSHGPAALRRAAFEASGFVIRQIVDAASTTGTGAKRFVATGGGTRNQAWLQAIADVLGQPVEPMAVPETAALGGAFLARMALGRESSMDGAVRWARCSAPVEPVRDWTAAADERYQRWRQGLPGRH
ncbi:MAG TPA: FGGY-family carbohydrate kinase [Acidimicrobiales bacterium]|nr:FGGY-family carbohydrate kinase [Acidimicrobiales bacterium]